jgi:hypothetical protein
MMNLTLSAVGGQVTRKRVFKNQTKESNNEFNQKLYPVNFMVPAAISRKMESDPANAIKENPKYEIQTSRRL